MVESIMLSGVSSPLSSSNVVIVSAVGGIRCRMRRRLCTAVSRASRRRTKATESIVYGLAATSTVILSERRGNCAKARASPPEISLEIRRAPTRLAAMYPTKVLSSPGCASRMVSRMMRLVPGQRSGQSVGVASFS